jgi:hypothetical protein
MIAQALGGDGAKTLSPNDFMDLPEPAPVLSPVEVDARVRQWTDTVGRMLDEQGSAGPS